MKNYKFVNYTKKVLSYIDCSSKTRKLINEDLYSNLLIRSEETGENDPVKLMGKPEKVAMEFIENMELERSKGFEYISGLSVFGIPLLHINIKRGGIAKGIIAIGNIALGLIALGNISIGLISIGAVSLAIFLSIGAFALSIGLSIGAFAASYFFSIGAAAFANDFAIGAYADAKIAMGEVTKGVVSIYKDHGAGEVLIKLPASKEVIIDAIKNVYPDINNIFYKLFISIL